MTYVVNVHTVCRHHLNTLSLAFPWDTKKRGGFEGLKPYLDSAKFIRLVGIVVNNCDKIVSDVELL